VTKSERTVRSKYQRKHALPGKQLPRYFDKYQESNWCNNPAINFLLGLIDLSRVF